jgi:hypothetical protein
MSMDRSGGMILKRKTEKENLGEKPVPVPLSTANAT